MRARRCGAIVGALVTVISGAVIGSGSAQADPGCPSLYVVAIPGTWETGKGAGPGMLASVTRGLPSNIPAEYVNYAATAFPWETDVYGRSKKQAVDNARGMVGAMAQRCGATKIALVGFSQGADAAGDLAAEIGTGIGVVPASRVAAVGLISDPRRSAADALVGPVVGGTGAGGPRIGGFGFVSRQTRTFCAPGDIFCSTASDDFVARFAGFLAQTSDPNPAQLSRYQQEAGAIVNDLMSSGGVALLQNQLTDGANEERREKLEQFYRSGVHNDYGYATSWVRNWLTGMA